MIFVKQGKKISNDHLQNESNFIRRIDLHRCFCITAYEKTGGQTAANARMAAKEFYCEICDKNLNGPQPYKMHMSSKAHREEMEYQGLTW